MLQYPVYLLGRRWPSQLFGGRDPGWTIKVLTGGHWGAGQLAFASPGGGAYAHGGTQLLIIYIGDQYLDVNATKYAPTMTLSVQGAPTVNTMDLKRGTEPVATANDLTFDSDAAYNVTVNAANDKFLNIVTTAGTVTLGGTLTVHAPGGCQRKG